MASAYRIHTVSDLAIWLKPVLSGAPILKRRDYLLPGLVNLDWIFRISRTMLNIGMALLDLWAVK